MKNINDLVKVRFGFVRTFKELQEEYLELASEQEENIKKNESVLEASKNSTDNKTLSLIDKINLYNSMIAQNRTREDIDINDLSDKFVNSNKDLKDYIYLKEKICCCRENMYEILREEISFFNFGEIFCQHQMVKLDGKLTCVCCGGTTEDYNLKEDEVEFLALCADRQGLFFKEVTKDDMPLLQVLKQKYDYYKSLRTPLEEVDENDIMTLAEDYWLDDTSEVTDIRREIRRAHMLDAGLLEDGDTKVSDPKYLSKEKAKQLLNEVDLQFILLQSNNSFINDLLDEEYKTIRYEILILSGQSIIKLYNEAKDEEEKIALIKAYYNMAKDEFRINSGYFNSDNQATFYNCRTAHPEINQHILTMKLR